MTPTETIVTIVVATLGSTGLWAFLSKIFEKKDSKTQLLIGLAHNRIIALGTEYLGRGYITKDEYENLHDYLFVPYQKAGGNGTAAKIMKEVDKLPISGLEDFNVPTVS